MSGDNTYTPHKSGQRLGNIHPRSACQGDYCPVHNWSDHHMVEWEQRWREDKRAFERICPEHGVGHPDPDDIYYRRSEYAATHGCCGCCAKPKTEPTHDLLKTV